jgi:hypothetical protein
MKNQTASRRQLLGAGAALALLAPAAIDTARAASEVDAELIQLCDRLVICSAEIVRINATEGTPDEVTMSAVERFRDISNEIVGTAAITPDGIKAKASALRESLLFFVCIGPGFTIGTNSTHPEILAWSLLHDILGEEPSWD